MGLAPGRARRLSSCLAQEPQREPRTYEEWGSLIVRSWGACGRLGADGRQTQGMKLSDPKGPCVWFRGLRGCGSYILGALIPGFMTLVLGLPRRRRHGRELPFKRRSRLLVSRKRLF